MRFSINIRSHYRIFPVGVVFVFFHLFASQSNATQPVTGSWTFAVLSNSNISSMAVDPSNPEFCTQEQLAEASSRALIMLQPGSL
jgi:hypothetical protein